MGARAWPIDDETGRNQHVSDWRSRKSGCWKDHTKENKGSVGQTGLEMQLEGKKFHQWVVGPPGMHRLWLPLFRL